MNFDAAHQNSSPLLSAYIKNIIFVAACSLVGYTAALGQCVADYTTANNFCDLSTLYLTAIPLGGVGPYSFEWVTGETTQTIIIPLAQGDYLVTITDANGCTVTINCHIKPSPLVLYYPYDQNACEGNTITLFLEWFRDSIPGATYLWSTGETTPTIQITDDLIWSVTVTDPGTGCEFVIPPGLFDFHPTPYPEIQGPQILCPGQTATLSVTGGPFGTIAWYIDPIWDPIYSNTLEITTPGTYYVWGSSPEAGYCWHQDTITILPGTIDPPVLTGPPELCSGQSGTISITNSALYTSFTWSTGASGATISVAGPGTYTVTVTNTGGCTVTGIIEIGDGSGFTPVGNITGAQCSGLNGAIDISVTPVAAYSYAWSNGASSQDLTGIGPGTYVVTVTSSAGCTVISSFIVPDIPIPINLQGTVLPNTSCNGTNGSVDLNITPSGAYSFLWSNGATTEDLGALGAGIYSVTVTLGTCSASAEFTVESAGNAPDVSGVTAASTCGLSNGSIDLSISGGATPYTFIWSNGATSEDQSDIGAGSYSVTITGIDGCMTTSAFVITDDPVLITLSAETLPVSSCNESNGTIDLTILPPAVYDILWSNGATTEDVSNLSEGPYTVTVTLGASCAETETFIVGSETTAIEVSAVVNPNTGCTAANGAIDLTVLPEENYTFSWSNGQSTEDIADLVAGTYTITITTPDGCTSQSTYIVEATMGVPTLAAMVLPEYCGQQNGSIFLSELPSASNVLWSNGMTSDSLSGLSAGSYTVTVTTVEGCTVADTFVVNSEGATFALSALVFANSSCTVQDGSIDLNVSPAGQYSYVWSNSDTTEDLAGLNAGDYLVTVTDDSGCQAVDTFHIDDNTFPPEIFANVESANCGQPTGGIHLTLSPDTGNTILWSDGSSSSDLLNILPGSYSVIVTGENGCTTRDTFTVGNTTSQFTINANVIHDESCTEDSGAIDLTIVPAGSYLFDWSTGMTTQDLNTLGPGIYSVTVTDTTGCKSIQDFIVEDNAQAPTIGNTIHPSICGQANGGIDIEIGAAGAYTVSWSNGAVTQNLMQVPAGNYTIVVTDAFGCVATAEYVIPAQGSSITLDAIVSSDTSCVTSTGSIDLQITPPGAYTFQWSNGALTEDLIALTGGLYTITVTDSLGCTSASEFMVETLATQPEIDGIVQPAQCGQLNGAIDLLVSPGSNAFLWSHGDTDKDVAALSPGTYSVTVTGANGCSSSETFIVPETVAQFSISIAGTANTRCDHFNGALDVSVSPAGNYTFIWSNGSTTEDLQDLAPGMYAVTIADPNNCSLDTSLEIINIVATPDIEGSFSPPACGMNNGSIDLTVDPPGGNIYLWSTGDTSEDLYALEPGNYAVTVTTQEGCTRTASFELPEPPAIEAHLGADVEMDYGQTITLKATVNVPIGSLDTTIWLPTAYFSCPDRVCLEQTLTPDMPLEVIFMVIDTNGCMAEAEINITLRSISSPDVYIPNVFSPNGDGANDVFTILGNADVSEISDLRIYDRWGEFIFQRQHFPPNDYSYGWDGSFRARVMDPQVFVYWTTVKFRDGSEKLFKGDVTLVR